MLKKDDKVDDRSRNGSNAGNPADGENVTLIKAVEKTAGERIKYGRRKCREFLLTHNSPKEKFST